MCLRYGKRPSTGRHALLYLWGWISSDISQNELKQNYWASDWIFLYNIVICERYYANLLTFLSQPALRRHVLRSKVESELFRYIDPPIRSPLQKFYMLISCRKKKP